MLKFKPDKLKARLLVMRWAVLGALVLAVGAVAVWGGARPQEARQINLADQLQSHIGEDTQPVLPAAAKITLPTPANEPPAETEIKTEIKAETEIKTETEPEAQTEPQPPEPAPEPAPEDTEVIDEAPEPWVGDELLTVEANLQQMLPPLSGMLQGSNGLLRGFGYGYDEIFGDYRFHGAVDLAGSLGAAVVAPLAGTVKEIKEDSFFGASVVLEHDGKLETAYFGLTPQPGLQTGQQVIAGEKLGELCAPPPFEANSAGAATPHLHWEIRLNGESLNPFNYL